MKQAIASTTSVILVAIAMLTVTMPAMATHNSIGHQIEIVDPSEVDQEGTLTPDIPHEDHPDLELEETSRYHQQFHESLLGDGLEPREAPFDQSGDRYTDCVGAQQAGDKYAPWDDEDQCYIGYFDFKKQYQYDTIPLLLPNQPDHLYAVNPSQDDEYCQGQEDTDTYTGEDVDETITSLDRRVGSLNPLSDEDRCNWTAHRYNVPAEIAIDMSLVEAPALETATGEDLGSGSWSLPLTGTTYIFIFGEPHPDAHVDGERFEAGSGPFGPNPVELGNPLHDLTGACGDRTQECKMLTPEDIKAYDHWEDPEQARVCGFVPQFTYSPAGDAEEERDQGCGVWGERADQFRGDTFFGGLGIDEAPPTWITNLPGWQWGVLYATENHFFGADAPGVWLQDDADNQKGYMDYWTVNPHVPLDGDDLRCVTPNILSEGDDEKLPDGFQDPGVYGPYMADAIDVDFYPHILPVAQEPLVDAFHEDVRDVLGPGQEVADQAVSDATDAAGLVDRAFDQVNVPDEVEDAVGDAADRADYFETRDSVPHAQPGDQNQHPFEASIPAGLACDATDTLTFNAAEVTLTVTSSMGASETFTVTMDDTLQGEPLEGDDVAIQGLTDVEALNSSHLVKLTFEQSLFDELADELFEETHTASLEAQYSPDGDQIVTETWIDAAPVVDGETAEHEVTFPEEVSAETPLLAGLVFQALVNQDTVNIKDPTLFGDDGLPVPESETDEGYWQPDTYSFSGEAHAVIDFSQNEAFASCPGANPSPGDDLCPWESLWDAYNPSCENFDNVPCGEVLQGYGYNIEGENGPLDEAGVGLYFVLELTGPAVVSTDLSNPDRTVVLGLGDPSAENCIVGTSVGFEDYLPNHIPGADTIEEVVETLCGHVDGDIAYFDDAFNNQDGTDRGEYSASVEWTKLLPTPDAQDSGAEDALCVSGIWSIGDTDIAGDTTGDNNINLAGNTVYEFSHWQSLETGTDTPGHSDTCPHQE